MTETITIKQKITKLANNFHRVHLEVLTESGSSYVSSHEYEDKPDTYPAYRTLMSALAGLSDCTVVLFSDCAEVVKAVCSEDVSPVNDLLAMIRTRQERYNIAIKEVLQSDPTRTKEARSLNVCQLRH